MLSNKLNLFWYNILFRYYQNSFNIYVSNGRKIEFYFEFSNDWHRLIKLVAEKDILADYEI